ncbi:chymotrypsin-2-like [Uranotaenia lowii]|uniref:chymotrypsin-2-like n=1 Tax=Uranotaenia lowii TaxID=190385 RepID=UPI00247A66F7|nr:chymotrypsin-2-like [Uranotaenia lowii]
MGGVSYFILTFLACCLLGITKVECIVGGHRADSSSAHFMVSVQNPTHICGGALVGTSSVLTTASCVSGRTNIKVLVGSHRLLTNRERVNASPVLHSSYSSTTGANNLAILKLEKSVTSSLVAVIALNDAAITTGKTTAFYGWGALQYGSTRSNELQTLYQRTLTNADCAKLMGNSGTLTTNQICARIQPSQAACSGDEGGPLVDVATGKLVGIYVYGVQCTGNKPDVFMNVLPYTSWINTNK